MNDNDEQPPAFRWLEPVFFAGLLDDPLLLARIRPRGYHILLDCGYLNHLAKRALKRVDLVFITHAHMDHFIGFDQLTRSLLVSSKTVKVFGPPGITDKIASRLQGYDWNLAEDFFCSFHVHEIFAEVIQLTEFRGATGFQRHCLGDLERDSLEIYSDRYIKVEADFCDHKIRTLFYKITEKPVFWVDDDKIVHLGLKKGPWLKQLKRFFYSDGPWPRKRIADLVPPPSPFSINGFDPAVLYEAIRKDYPLASIGYITDIGFTEDNRTTLRRLLKNVTLLVCECTYLQEQREKARISCHLCTTDLNRIAQELSPAYLLPMHLSKIYLNRTDELYQELTPPPGCQLIRIPDRLTSKPLLPSQAVTLPPLN